MRALTAFSRSNQPPLEADFGIMTTSLAYGEWPGVFVDARMTAAGSTARPTSAASSRPATRAGSARTALDCPPDPSTAGLTGDATAPRAPLRQPLNGRAGPPYELTEPAG